jgi:hypothetical protein
MEEISSGDWKESWNREQDRLINDQTHEFLVLAAVLDLDVWLATLIDDPEGELLDIGLYFRIGEFATNKTLRIEDAGEGDQFVDRLIRLHERENSRILWIHRCLVLCGVTGIRRPVSEKETQEGVLRLPWSLGMIST